MISVFVKLLYVFGWKLKSIEDFRNGWVVVFWYLEIKFLGEVGCCEF